MKVLWSIDRKWERILFFNKIYKLRRKFIEAQQLVWIKYSNVSKALENFSGQVFKSLISMDTSTVRTKAVEENLFIYLKSLRNVVLRKYLQFGAKTFGQVRISSYIFKNRRKTVIK